MTGWVSLIGSRWQVEDSDEGGIIGRSHSTLEFESGGRIVGSTGCNGYVGTVALDGERFAGSGTGSTRRACAPAIRAQEHRFLTALNEVQHFRIGQALWLLLYDAHDRRRIRAILLEEAPG